MAGAPGVNPEPDLVCDRSIYSYMYIYTSCPSLSYMESILNLILCVTGSQLYSYMYKYSLFLKVWRTWVNLEPDHMCDGSTIILLHVYIHCRTLGQS